MHLWNCDETGFNGDKGDAKEITKRGAKRPLILTGNNEKINFIVFNCVNVDGFLQLPFVVYKSKNRLYDDWVKGGPRNTLHTTSLSGWMESNR